MTCTLDSLSQFIQRPSSKRFINGFKVRVSVISHSPKLSNGNGSSGPRIHSGLQIFEQWFSMCFKCVYECVCIYIVCIYLSIYPSIHPSIPLSLYRSISLSLSICVCDMSVFVLHLWQTQRGPRPAVPRRSQVLTSQVVQRHVSELDGTMKLLIRLQELSRAAVFVGTCHGDFPDFT